MKHRMCHRLILCALSGAIMLTACVGGHSSPDSDKDESITGDGGSDASQEGGPRSDRGDADVASDAAADARTPSQADATSPGDSGASGSSSDASTSDGGGGSSQMDGGTIPTEAGAMVSTDSGSTPPVDECANKAKEACEYQKTCDPVQFALDWDDDMNKFCIPKRKAACEAKLQVTEYRAIGEACDGWVHKSCDNYRNFFYKVRDSNGKWVYGDAACEVTPKPVRGDLGMDQNCTADFQCRDGLFCKTESDNPARHGEPDAELICGKCTQQYAYEEAHTASAFAHETNVCYRPDMCKAGYQCLAVYGTELMVFGGLDKDQNGGDYRHCVKAIAKAAKDKDCARESDAQCQDGLVCAGAAPADIVGICKVPTDATIPTYVGKDARCDPALCDPRLHLECKPVKTATTTENRCVQKPVAFIGGYCKNDAKDSVADCSRYGRCMDSSGQCVRRNLENESCFPTSATPSTFDQGSCDPSVYAETFFLVCRQEGGELAPHCHKATFSLMCSQPE
jgi:hypothetical protein